MSVVDTVKEHREIFIYIAILLLTAVTMFVVYQVTHPIPKPLPQGYVTIR
jgi:hypothetical protein